MRTTLLLACLMFSVPQASAAPKWLKQFFEHLGAGTGISVGVGFIPSGSPGRAAAAGGVAATTVFAIKEWNDWHNHKDTAGEAWGHFWTGTAGAAAGSFIVLEEKSSGKSQQHCYYCREPVLTKVK